ncbi:recombination and repair protein RecT [Fusobacterium necrophorum subsp. funduliforme ATCC 51357]|uniref:recombinase RecT n=2 Tax=Fusobacterium necrophorum TaxID=859 RepID=UPI00025E6B03|nr:recombinase RecT [Fusobacterium necrophorum]EIJ70682.1 recombination and repair protein RecT [Fusobacterium necrophorum subsp. funduliforme ATCC 51357]KAB0552219.1 recombinase RecT [Fusobacterium necrophorum subsp. funduliforme]KYM52845.1 recombinase RecT [Fusobacterium necrophorum subsp. funduliforme]KYM59791.1 recombinase RecT [Fusobacterium necrophorum subsp. funduliforme]
MTTPTAKNSLTANNDRGVGETKKHKTIFDVVQAGAKQFATALPKHVNSERFVRIAITTIRQNPKLAKCSQESLLGALMVSAQLGLEPGMLGQCYLIPFENKKAGVIECQFQIGYKGLIELLRRSGQLSDIYSYVVYENDEFSIEYGLSRTLMHKPNFDERGEIRGFYAVAILKDGAKAFEYMTRDEVVKHEEKYRKGSFKNDVWNKNFEEMAQKTVVKKLLKWLPVSVEFLENINRDEKTSNWNEQTKEVEVSDELVIDEETGEIVDNSNIGRDDIAKGLFAK